MTLSRAQIAKYRLIAAFVIVVVAVSVTPAPAAIPILYWMLECTACDTRFVVHDSYLVFVGTSGLFPMPGSGYEGPPLPERYTCAKGCSRPLRVIGCIFDPEDETMWVHDPHSRIQMTEAQSREWRDLIQASGLQERPVPSSRQGGCLSNR